MAGNKRDDYSKDIQNWLEGPGGKMIAVLGVVLVLWGLVVIFG